MQFRGMRDIETGREFKSYTNSNNNKDKTKMYVGLGLIIMGALYVLSSAVGTASPKWTAETHINLREQPLTIAIVADLDKKSKVTTSKKPNWKSIIKVGSLGMPSSTSYSVSWDKDFEISTAHGEVVFPPLFHC
jgi:hypothetical protein